MPFAPDGSWRHVGTGRGCFLQCGLKSRKGRHDSIYNSGYLSDYEFSFDFQSCGSEA